MRDFFSATHEPATRSELACSTALSLRVTIYDEHTLLAGPHAAQALGDCAVAASGTFTCHVDVPTASTGLVAIVDDSDNASSDCVAATSVVLETDAYVIPKHISDDFDRALSDNPLGALAQTGAIISWLTDPTGAPQAGGLPVMPVDCANGALSCEQLIVIAKADGTPTIDPAAAMTGPSGLWIAQVLSEDTQGKPQAVETDVKSLSQAYGAIDCSGAATCYAPQIFLPVRAGEMTNAAGKPMPAIFHVNRVKGGASLVNGKCPSLAAVANVPTGWTWSCPK